MHEATLSAALVALLDVSHAVHPFGNPPHEGVAETHCRVATQPLVVWHVATALEQSLHFVGLHEQRSKEEASDSPASVVLVALLLAAEVPPEVAAEPALLVAPAPPLLLLEAPIVLLLADDAVVPLLAAEPPPRLVPTCEALDPAAPLAADEPGAYVIPPPLLGRLSLLLCPVPPPLAPASYEATTAPPTLAVSPVSAAHA